MERKANEVTLCWAQPRGAGGVAKWHTAREEGSRSKLKAIGPCTFPLRTPAGPAHCPLPFQNELAPAQAVKHPLADFGLGGPPVHRRACAVRPPTAGCRVTRSFVYNCTFQQTCYGSLWTN